MTSPASEADGADATRKVQLSVVRGRRIGRYQITSRIGAGGMGEVYEATDTLLNRKVAIKMLPPRVAGDPHARARFEWEARAVAGLNHPHICTLYDIGHEEGIAFLVMELLEGEMLSGPMPIDEAVRLASEIASALQSAHDHGILHRDLKPSNVMRTQSGAKLLDFGLAKSIERDLDVTRTSPGTVVGTVAYMSPEQAEGKPIDVRSDIFSFGAVLYEMVGGRQAFSGDTPARVISAVLRDEPPPLAAPSSLQQIVRRCLAKEPSQRFHSMAEVREALATLAPGIAEKPSIAVLPFASVSADPENEFFSDGISEEIINALTQVRGLQVAARTSSFSFKGKSLAVGEIASRLRVRHVLEGSVRRSGGRVRVTAQLVDASNGYQLWSERYDRELADIFDVQDEIARAIVERLKVALTDNESSRLVKVTTSNMEAYHHYLKGRVMLYRRGPWIARSLESFQTAVVLDPDYAQAWAGVADAYTGMAYTGARRPDLVMPAAVQASARAIRLDAAAPEAHLACAMVALLWERDFERAGREFLQALALNPQFTFARSLYGLFYLQYGLRRDAAGLAEAQRAFDSDPLSSFAASVLAFSLSTVGRLDEALSRARVGVQLDPESFLARWQLAFVCHWSGNIDDALGLLEPLWAETAHNWVAFALSAVYVKAGRHEEARSIYEALLLRSHSDYVPPFSLALCAAALGEVEAALGFCEAGIETRDMFMALVLNWWPDFDVVRADPRYLEIVTRFNSRRSRGAS
jgi:serine/threonine-protein kinase